MKKIYFILSLAFTTLSGYVHAQCSAGYTQAQLNWDNVDYYWNSGGSGTAPYEAYITNSLAQTQKFAIGKSYLTISLSNVAMLNPGAGMSAENTTHTGDLVGYTGADVQYNPTANGQSITLTFNNEVQNASFSLYDIDANAVFTITATNAANVPQTILVTNKGSILTLGGIETSRTLTANSTILGNSSNNGSATITVAGPVKTIVVTVTTIGTDPVFWLSDINACVTGTFPTNYNRTGNNQPFTGPTQNQPDYFIVTPDNNKVYMVDPATGYARLLFTEPVTNYVNSLAYDPYNRSLWYISENSSINPNNKTLKRLDLSTGTSTVVVADITATLGIPVFNYGIESAAASFYDGAVYIGIEGGKIGTTTRETIVWRIDLDASQNPTVAYQVFATDAYSTGGGTSIHDYGDLIVKNGVLYDFNTARNGTNYSQSKYHHYNLMTGAVTVYNNPGTTQWNGQAAMTWAGSLYYFRNTGTGTSGVGVYNENGTNSAPVNITVVDGTGAWPGGNGDAAENFRPKCDFGDAPDSYDPDPVSPAVHERSDNIRLGATWDNEWVKAGDVNANLDGSDEDGLAYVQILTPGAWYYNQVTVFNNSGANATLIGWLDKNANGIFESTEASTPITVPSSASSQSFYIDFGIVNTPLVPGQYTFMRIRITSASAGMTTSHPTGYFTNGEVEDYRVPVDNYPLAVQMMNFDANLTADKKVKLNWTVNEDDHNNGFEIQRSNNSIEWKTLGYVHSNRQAGANSYVFYDNNPLSGKSYYRIRYAATNSTSKYSEIRSVEIKKLISKILLVPNPAKEKTYVSIETSQPQQVEMVLMSAAGNVAWTGSAGLVAGANSIEIPLEKFPSGNYVLQVKTSEGVLNKKLVIRR